LQRKTSKKGRRSGGAEGGQRGAARVYRAASVWEFKGREEERGGVVGVVHGRESHLLRALLRKRTTR
jgi:hypothetical protein